MSRDVSDEEYAAVLRQTAEKQYDYFVHKVADSRVVWLLGRGGTELAMLSDTPDGPGDAVAVWPHERYAQACVRRDWADYEPVELPLEEFLDQLVPELARDDVDLAVMHMPDRRSVRVPARRVRSDLEAELQKSG